MINSLPNDLLAQIFQWMSLKDIFKCMTVCLHWKEIINQDFFWKRILYRDFDIEPSKEKFELSILKEWRDDWDPYFTEKGEENCYVFKHLPNVLGCDIITPSDFKVDKNYKNLAVALEKLHIMSKRYIPFNSISIFY